jgi:nitroreductase
MHVSEAIRTKRAVRKFKPEPLPEEVVHQIINAGRLAQSSKNNQPWNFIIVQEREMLTALSKLGDYAGHIAGAAMAVVIVTADPFQHYSPLFDSGQAAAYMQLAAWELGVGSCLATLHQWDEARKVLGFPMDKHVRMAISFGYPADEALAPRPARKEGRRPFDEVIHWEKW